MMCRQQSQCKIPGIVYRFAQSTEDNGTPCEWYLLLPPLVNNFSLNSIRPPSLPCPVLFPLWLSGDLICLEDYVSILPEVKKKPSFKFTWRFRNSRHYSAIPYSLAMIISPTFLVNLVIVILAIITAVKQTVRACGTTANGHVVCAVKA